MAVYKVAIAVLLVVAIVEAQRPFYAGLRPIGYPQIESETLFNKFGEDSDAPIIAKGDANLINRLNQLPVDKQPFWFINSKQYDELRKNPQTYPQRPSPFINNGRK